MLIMMIQDRTVENTSEIQVTNQSHISPCIASKSFINTELIVKSLTAVASRLFIWSDRTCLFEHYFISCGYEQSGDKLGESEIQFLEMGSNISGCCTPAFILTSPVSQLHNHSSQLQHLLEEECSS